MECKDGTERLLGLCPRPDDLSRALRHHAGSRNAQSSCAGAVRRKLTVVLKSSVPRILWPYLWSKEARTKMAIDHFESYHWWSLDDVLRFAPSVIYEQRFVDSVGCEIARLCAHKKPGDAAIIRATILGQEDDLVKEWRARARTVG